MPDARDVDDLHPTLRGRLVRLDGADAYHVQGEIDVASQAALRRRMSEVIAAGSGDVVMELSEVSFIDSTGLRMMLDLHRTLTGQGRRLRLRGAQGPVRRLFELTAMFEILEREPPR